MFKTSPQRAGGALLAAFLLLAGCGGDDAPVRLTFTVTAVVPSVSNDINGGDLVTVQGTNFLAVTISSVTFGAQPGIIERTTITDTSIQVTTPPAPGGTPGVVRVEVVTVEANSKFVPGDYTYVSGSGTPQPQTITPTTFTPTGAQDFTIQGTNLGPGGGNVDVIFNGVGTARGTVSLDGQFVQGRAPVSAGLPPAGSIVVTIDTGTATADVPTQVTYAFALPAAVPVPYQAPNGASRPVRLSDGFAVLSTSGGNAVWGDLDDDVVLVLGPPTPGMRRILGPGGTPVGYLDANNSIPAVLDPNTVCVYSVGPNGVPDVPSPTVPPDDTVVLITNAQSPTPTVTPFVFGFLNTAPLAAIAPNRVAFTAAGSDLGRGTADDMLHVWEFNGGLPGPVGAQMVGEVDVTPGRTNFSLPYSPDGDAVFVMSVGPNGTPRNGDDQLWRFTFSTMTARSTPLPFVWAPPHAISPTLLAAPGAGANRLFGDADDTLVVVTDTGGFFNLAGTQTLGSPFDRAAVVPIAPLGTGGVVVPVVSAMPVLAFPSPTGSPASLAMIGTPLLAPLGSGELIVFAPGGPPPGDEQAVRIAADASSSQPFALVPTLTQALRAHTDADRAFGASPGPDGSWGTSDDSLTVHQTRALGLGIDIASLPIQQLPGLPITGQEPFVPIGPDWGIIQSPGPLRVYLGPSDQVLVVRY
ncbi:MAG: IPT/TIG domain-containing protein [Planctomycetota bacterium]|jgi:hypothetical protein